MLTFDPITSNCSINNEKEKKRVVNVVCVLWHLQGDQLEAYTHTCCVPLLLYRVYVPIRIFLVATVRLISFSLNYFILYQNKYGLSTYYWYIGEAMNARINVHTTVPSSWNEGNYDNFTISSKCGSGRLPQERSITYIIGSFLCWL